MRVPNDGLSDAIIKKNRHFYNYMINGRCIMIINDRFNDDILKRNHRVCNYVILKRRGCLCTR